MKKILIILLVFIPASSYSQQLSGKFIHFKNSFFKIRYSPDIITLKDDTVHVNEKGEFSFHFKMNCPAILALFLSEGIKQDVFLGPGLTLNLNADLTNKKSFDSSIQFTGIAARYNLFYSILQASERFRSVDYYKRFDEYVKLPMNEKIELVKAYKFTKDSIRHHFFSDLKKDKLAMKFFLADSMETQYGNLSAINSISNQHIPREERMQFIKQYISPHMTETNDPVILSGWWYRYTWFSYAYRIYFDAKARGDTVISFSNNAFERYFTNLDRLVTSPRMTEMIYAHWYLPAMVREYKFLEEKDFPSWDSAFERLSKRISSKQMVAQFRKDIDANKGFAIMNKKGKQSPDFLLLDINGKAYRQTDFKEKLLVLDIWASWCTPCIKEFPYMDTLQKKLAGRNDIIFINVSVDNFRSNWIEKGLQKFSPPGLSLWAKNGDVSRFYKDYRIFTVPHIMVIDKTGKFIEYSAPYPSDGDKLEKLIKQVLQL